MASDITETQDMDVQDSGYSDPSDFTSDSGYDGQVTSESSYNESYNPSLSEQVQSLGFSNVQDDQDARYRLLESYQQLQDQNNQWAQYYNQTAQSLNEYQQQAQQWQQLQQSQQWQQYQQWQQQQQQQQQQPQQQAQPEEPQHWWAPPQVDLDEVAKYRVQQVNPETGQIETVWAQGTPQEIINGSQEYASYLENWADGIVRRPNEVLPSIIEQEFDKLFASRYGALVEYNNNYFQAQQQQQTVQDINNRNADWVYQIDPRTNEFVRDANGQQVLTPQGQAVTQYVNYFRGIGVDDPSTLWDLATRMYAGDISSAQLQQHQQQAEAAQAAAQRNVQYQQPAPAPAPAPVQPAQYAESIAPAGGSLAFSEDPISRSQNPHMSAGEKLRQQGLTDGLF